MKNREKRIENLQRSNKESHRLIVDSLRQALYTMLKTRDIDSIKVVDLVKAAGVSRGGFYRNFYLVTDVLKDDIRVIADDVRRVSGCLPAQREDPAPSEGRNGDGDPPADQPQHRWRERGIQTASHGVERRDLQLHSVVGGTELCG